jgi:hypothetical protein
MVNDINLKLISILKKISGYEYLIVRGCQRGRLIKENKYMIINVLFPSGNKGKRNLIMIF